MSLLARRCSESLARSRSQFRSSPRRLSARATVFETAAVITPPKYLHDSAHGFAGEQSRQVDRRRSHLHSRYDADGNRTERQGPAAVTYYAWDEDGRMVAAEPVAGPVTFTYRADGRRVRKETSVDVRRFRYDLKRLLEHLNRGGSSTVRANSSSSTPRRSRSVAS